MGWEKLRAKGRVAKLVRQIELMDGKTISNLPITLGKPSRVRRIDLHKPPVKR